MNKLSLLFLSVLFPVSIITGQPEDPIKIGFVDAEYKKSRSILKLGCELRFSHPWHINSDSLQQDYLIETRIVIADTASGHPVKREFPDPTTITLFGEKMEVFDKDVSFKEFFYINPGRSFPLKFKLQYQSCSDKICLPPKFHNITVNKTAEGKVRASL